MESRNKVSTIIIICIAVVMFFIPKTGCGYDYNFVGGFERYRCSCAGFALKDPFGEQGYDQSGREYYSCFGMKIGQTKLIDFDTGIGVSSTFVVHPAGIKISKDSSKSLLVGIKNDQKKEKSYTLDIYREKAVGHDMEEIENNIKFLAAKHDFRLEPLAATSFPLVIDAKDVSEGTYVLKLEILDSEGIKESKKVYIEVS